MRRRMMTLCRPYDFEVDWIASDGTRKIATDVYAKSPMTIYTGFTPTEITDNIILSGVVGEDNQIMYGVVSWPSGSWFYRYGAKSKSTSQMYANTRYDTVSVATHNAQYLNVNGNRFITLSNNVDIDTGMNFFLFDVHRFDGVSFPMKAKLHYNRFVGEDGIVLADFIPVSKNRLGYLFDRVSGKLYGDVNNGNVGFPEALVGPKKT